MRPRVWATFALVGLAVAVLLGLGGWQVLRLFDSQETRERFDERIAEPPIAWPPPADADPDALAFRRIEVSGEWDFDRSQFLTARPRYGLLGEEVITPLRPDGGGPALLINRGWYPVDQRAVVLAELGGERRAQVEGLLRTSPSGESQRTPEGAWRWFHVAGMAQELPYPAEPYQFVQGRLATDAERTAILSQQLPVQLYIGYIDDTPHLEYALTWFGLAAALIATVIIRVRAERRGPPQPAVGQRDSSRAL